MLLAPKLLGVKIKNSYHSAKNNLAQFHTTHIVQQGSPILVWIFRWKRIHKYVIDSFNFQEVFHSAVHWLKASGITQKLVDDYMNAEPYIPLPKKNKNKPLVLEQLIMLWIISISGWAIGLLVFFGELVAGGFSKHLKRQAGRQRNRIILWSNSMREVQG